MPELAGLDAPTRRAVLAIVDRLREALDPWCRHVLDSYRQLIPAYDVISDEEILGSVRALMEGTIAELSSLRLPDPVARQWLEDLARRRAAQGLPLEALAQGYQLGSREMLTVVDEAAEEMGLPTDLLLAVHDHSWEFANEAAAIFARVQGDLAVQQARVDAERRSRFARAVLQGAMPAEQVRRDASLFGLDAGVTYVPVVGRAATPDDADATRRAIAAAVATSPTRLLLTEVDTVVACLAPMPPERGGDLLLATGAAATLDAVSGRFDDALLALATAEQLGLTGVVGLDDLGPGPLVLEGAGTAARLARRHLAALETRGRSGRDVEDTARVFLACDRQVAEAAARLNVHPNTVRYRMSRFRSLTGLDVTRTQDLVSAWLVLHRSGGPPSP